MTCTRQAYAKGGWGGESGKGGVRHLLGRWKAGALRAGLGSCFMDVTRKGSMLLGGIEGVAL